MAEKEKTSPSRDSSTDAHRPEREPKGREGAGQEKNELSFEASLDRLEKIVQELEKGDLALERAIELFEEGMQLSAGCRKKLEEAENRVEILLKKSDGKIIAEPFGIGENNNS